MNFSLEEGKKPNEIPSYREETFHPERGKIEKDRKSEGERKKKSLIEFIHVVLVMSRVVNSFTHLLS